MGLITRHFERTEKSERVLDYIYMSYFSIFQQKRKFQQDSCINTPHADRLKNLNFCLRLAQSLKAYFRSTKIPIIDEF